MHLCMRGVLVSVRCAVRSVGAVNGVPCVVPSCAEYRLRGVPIAFESACV